jgi:hypothetical protein
MPDLLAIAQGLNALKATTDIIKAMVGLRDAAQILEKTVDLNQKILAAQTALADAQMEQTALIQTIRDREEEIARLKAWETEKQRYELKDVAMGSGSFAYIIKPTAQGGEPLHCLCAYCYENGKKRVMQTTGRLLHGRRLWSCPDCKNDIIMSWWPPYGYPGSKEPSPPESPN